LEIFTTVSEVGEFVNKKKQKGFTIGFVPTMGALHNGHLNLVKTAKLHTDIVVASVFINPTQFNDKGDFERYPRTLENDTQLLQNVGCQALFAPAVAEIYPESDAIIYHFGFLTNTLEGSHRPGHFSGVINVVKRLFEIVTPDKAYFGKKDYQQYMVIKKLTEHFGFDIDIEGCETTREISGLAMSSRNKLLTEEEKEKATILYKTLIKVKTDSLSKSLEFVNLEALNTLKNNKNLVLDYFSIVDANTLVELKEWDNSKNAMVLIAATFGKIRLIDNMLIY
jgi:pantoate--beta-alanine ligase